MEKVIIINATELGYQVIRALGEKGIRSYVVYDKEKDEIGRYSKYVLQAHKVPKYIEEPSRLLEFLLAKKEEWKGTLILPTKDYGVEFLAANKEILSPHYIIPTPGIEVIRGIVNKKNLYQTARKMGIDISKTFYPKSFEDLEALKSEIRFPCLLKPGLGHKFFRRFDFKMLEIHNFADLSESLSRITDGFRDDSYEIMISEIIPGLDSEHMIQFVSYIDREGEMLASMTSRKLRQDPPKYGQGRVAKSEKIADVNEVSLRLLKELGYYGFSEIEWKYDFRDRCYKLIEINPRYIFYIGLCVACGINFPYIQYMDLAKDRKVKIPDFEEGVYWIHLYKDVLHTLFHHHLENIPLREYLIPYLNKKAFAVWKPGDPFPFIQQWKQHLGNMIVKRYAD